MMMSEILFIIGFVTLTLGGFILGANLAFIPTKIKQKCYILQNPLHHN